MPRLYSHDLRWPATWIKESFLDIAWMTTHNTLRDCRVHLYAFFQQPFSKQLYMKQRKT